MKKLILALSLFSLVLTACNSEDKSETPFVNEDKPEDILAEEFYQLGDYEVLFDVPEGLQVSQSLWDEEHLHLFIDESDLSEAEGDFLFMVHHIRIYEDTNIEDRKEDYSNYAEYAPLSIELDGESYERILYYSDFGGYHGVSYLMEIDNNVIEFIPSAEVLGETANSESDLEMIEIIKSFIIQ